MAQAEEQIRLQGYAQIAGTQLRKFIVEREMPAIDAKKYDEMKIQVDRVNKATEALWPRISWVESFMCNNKMYCVYLADSAATLQKHALLALRFSTPLDAPAGIVSYHAVFDEPDRSGPL